MAFANLVPDGVPGEATIDLMRRHPEAHKSTMEFLFVSLFEWAKDAGYQTFNLGPSPFAGIGQQSDDPAAERLIADGAAILVLQRERRRRAAHAKRLARLLGTTGRP